MTLTSERPHAADLSLLDVRDVNPYPIYERLREAGSVVWDDGMRAWLVLDHEGCAFVERREDLFAEPTRSLPGAAEITGPREFRSLVGEPHRRLHQYLSHRWQPAAVEPYRDEFVRPIVKRRVAAAAAAGRFELWQDVASLIPVAVIARIIGLPAADEELRRYKAWMDAVLGWRHTYGREPERVEAAIDASRRLDGALIDLVRLRREEPADDLVSGLWEIGPTIGEDWGERDVLDNLKPLFEAGAETTALLITSAIYLLFGEAATLRNRVLGGGADTARFVDEVLRHTTVVHWRARVATEDIELGGVAIHAGDRVHPINAAANRDPARWPDPARFDIDRARLPTHLAFNVGPRHCSGSHLARVEAAETILGLFREMPGLRPDPAAAPPIYAGYVTRAWKPQPLLAGPAG